MESSQPRLVRCTSAADMQNKYVLVKPSYTLGRSSDRDILVQAEFVSSMHAEIIYHNERHYVIDKSRNGVWVNGIPIAPEQRVALSHGSVLGLGDDRKDFQYLNEQQTADRPEHRRVTQSSQSTQPRQWGSLIILNDGRVRREGKPIRMGQLERKLLECLLEKINELIPNKDILEHIYEKEPFIDTRDEFSRLHRIIKRVREKLGDTEGKIIINERGGYLLSLPEE